jgi:hypothetical protein
MKYTHIHHLPLFYLTFIILASEEGYITFLIKSVAKNLSGSGVIVFYLSSLNE